MIQPGANNKPQKRGDRWFVNRRYYAFAVNTNVVGEVFDDWTRPIAERERWARLERSRHPNGKAIVHQSDWGGIASNDTPPLYQLWWFFKNENDALLFKLRWC